MPASVESSAARGVARRTRSATKRAGELDEPRAEAGDAGPPARRRAPDRRRPRRRGERLRRQHDEEHVREERDGVDAVRAARRRRVRPVRAASRRAWQRVEDVADEQRDRGARQDAAVHQLGRKAEHAPAQRVDQEKLDEIVEREPEEAVDVAANDPPHAESIAALTAPAR